MLYLKHSGGPFPDGDYDVDLVIDHQRLATISLTVGGSGVVGKVNGVTITAFFSATSRDGAQWFKGSNHRQLPARTSHFSASTTQFWLIFAYKGATPNVTTEEMMLRGPDGLKYTDGPAALTDTTGAYYSKLNFKQNQPFSKGSYSVVLYIDGQKVTKIAFSIG